MVGLHRAEQGERTARALFHTSPQKKKKKNPRKTQPSKHRMCAPPRNQMHSEAILKKGAVIAPCYQNYIVPVQLHHQEENRAGGSKTYRGRPKGCSKIVSDPYIAHNHHIVVAIAPVPDLERMYQEGKIALSSGGLHDAASLMVMRGQLFEYLKTRGGGGGHAESSSVSERLVSRCARVHPDVALERRTTVWDWTAFLSPGKTRHEEPRLRERMVNAHAPRHRHSPRRVTNTSTSTIRRRRQGRPRPRPRAESRPPLQRSPDSRLLDGVLVLAGHLGPDHVPRAQPLGVRERLVRAGSEEQADDGQGVERGGSVKQGGPAHDLPRPAPPLPLALHGDQQVQDPGVPGLDRLARDAGDGAEPPDRLQALIEKDLHHALEPSVGGVEDRADSLPLKHRPVAGPERQKGSHRGPSVVCGGGGQRGGAAPHDELLLLVVQRHRGRRREQPDQIDVPQRRGARERDRAPP